MNLPLETFRCKYSMSPIYMTRKSGPWVIKKKTTELEFNNQGSPE